MDEFESLLSEGELAYIRSGPSENFRIDGRSCFDCRDINVQIGKIPRCNGSAQVESTNCHLTVGVKAEVGLPDEDEPNQGLVEINVSCSANASPKFEGRGGEDISQEIGSILSNAILPTIDRTKLCICRGHKVWHIYVDVLVLECSSIAQLIDLSAIGIKAALIDTRIPHVIPDEEDPDDFIIVNEVEDFCPVDVMSLPLMITFTKIKDSFVADVTEEEQAAGTCRVTFAFDMDSQFLYSKKTGLGNLDPQSLRVLIKQARNSTLTLHNTLNNQIKTRMV